MTKERIQELSDLFWSETEVPWTQAWRGNLTNEEYFLIREWDIQISRGFRNLCTEIHRLQKLSEQNAQ